METETIDFKHKYMKYKLKYFSLKNQLQQIGGTNNSQEHDNLIKAKLKLDVLNKELNRQKRIIEQGDNEQIKSHLERELINIQKRLREAQIQYNSAHETYEKSKSKQQTKQQPKQQTKQQPKQQPKQQTKQQPKQQTKQQSKQQQPQLPTKFRRKQHKYSKPQSLLHLHNLNKHHHINNHRNTTLVIPNDDRHRKAQQAKSKRGVPNRFRYQIDKQTENQQARYKPIHGVHNVQIPRTL